MKNIENTARKELLNEDLQSQISELKQKNDELKALVRYYEELIRLSKHRQFGKSSEQSENCVQLGLFDEVENAVDKKKSEPIYEEIAYVRKKRKGKREEDLSKLPVETIEYTLPEAEQICPECSSTLHTMSKEIRREIQIVPARVKVIEHVQYLYACRNCEKNNDHVPIIKAASPEPVIKGSLASSSAVAHIMVQKYVNAVPLYRQEQDFLRNDVALSRQTMANWIIRCAEDWLEPIYDRMKELLLKQAVLHADETSLQVLKEPGKKADTNSYMWLYRTSGDAEHPIVLYEYQPTRSSSHPKRFLAGFSGYLHTDGYAGYHNLPQITVVGCWAHARRKFDESLKAIPPAERKGSSSEKGIDYCNRLFMMEREFKELMPDERLKKRSEQSVPLADEFFTWATKLKALPGSTLGKAVYYALSQRAYLENVFLDGRLELSNNRAERSIKPFVIGRKNWLFCNTQKGAKASSIVYSIIETAKENGVNPFDYIKFLLDTLPNSNSSMLNEVFPWSDAVKRGL